MTLVLFASVDLQPKKTGAIIRSGLAHFHLRVRED